MMNYISIFLVAAMAMAPLAEAEEAAKTFTYWKGTDPEGKMDCIVPNRRGILDHPNFDDAIALCPKLVVTPDGDPDAPVCVTVMLACKEQESRRLLESMNARMAGRRLKDLSPKKPKAGDTIEGSSVTFKASGVSIGDKVVVQKSDGTPVFTWPVDGTYLMEDGEFKMPFDIIDTDSDTPTTYKWFMRHAETAENGTITVSETDPNEFTVNTIVRRSGTTTTTTTTGIVSEAAWDGGGQVLGAVGRIYFASVDENGTAVDYACTGTAVRDNKSGRSLVLTAAHCVFDDIDWNFGANAIFIPNRDSVDTAITGNDVHRSCAGDVCGCWSLSGGVVHDKWADTPWPARLDYDYGFYIVNDIGHHQGSVCGDTEALDSAIEELDFAVGTTVTGETAYAFGYSLDHNPDFRYCSQAVTERVPTTGVVSHWLDKCGLTGGASGGPWITGFDPATGKGQIVTVNSWSYSSRTGMGGPKIHESEARCLINAARDLDIDELEAQPDYEEGLFINCYDRPCIEDESTVRRLRGSGERQLCSKQEKH